jgi:hypothetical protein
VETTRRTRLRRSPSKRGRARPPNPLARSDDGEDRDDDRRDDD